MLPACHSRGIMRERHLGREGSICRECGAIIPAKRPEPPVSKEVIRPWGAFTGLQYQHRKMLKARYRHAME